MILGASFDTPAENAAFKQKKAFTYPLLCDVDRKLGLAYGACTDRSAKYPDRISVVIGHDGNVARVYPKVNPVTHVDEVLRDLGGTPPKEGLLKKLFRK